MIDVTISVSQAAAESGKHPETLRRWVRKYPALGFRFGPKGYRVQTSAWAQLLSGDHPSVLT